MAGPNKRKVPFQDMSPAEQLEAMRSMTPAELAQLRRQAQVQQASTGDASLSKSLSSFDDAAVADRAAATKKQETDFAATQAKVGKQAADQQRWNKEKVDLANGFYGETYAPEGIDQTNKGVGEQLWGLKEKDFFAPTEGQRFSEANAGTYGAEGFGEKGAKDAAGQLGKTGAGEDYWQGVQGKYNKGGPSYVQDVHKSFDASVDPNLGGYYDHAFNQAAGGINKQLAARGQFGSSAGMQQIGNAAVGLNAERANREAAYGLDRYRTQLGSAQAASADEQGWVQGLGDLAFRSGEARRARVNDSAAQAASAQTQQFDRLNQAYGQAANNDQQVASNRSAGFSAAFGAQDRRDNRIQQGFDNQIGFGAVLAGMGNARIQNNYAATAGGAAAELGAATDSYNANAASSERQYQEYLSTYKGAVEAAASYAPAKKPDPKRK